jgi:hypothetical protein
VLQEFTTEEQSSVVLFCGQKDSMQKIFVKKWFLVILGSVCRVKRFHLGGKTFVDDEEVEKEVRKWLRQQQGFYAASFDALVKRCDRRINVGGGYVEKQIFFPGSNITYFIPICDLFTYSPSYYR